MAVDGGEVLPGELVTTVGLSNGNVYHSLNEAG